MKRLLLVFALLVVVAASAVRAQPRTDTTLLQDTAPSASKFNELVETGDWAALSEENGRWRLRLVGERDKALLEERVRRWRQGHEQYERKVAELQPEMNLLEDRLRILTGFSRSANERFSSDHPQNKQAAQEREQTENRLAQLRQQLATMERENQPPRYMGTTWRQAELAQVVEIGDDYIGLQSEDAVSYYRLADIAVIQRPIPRRGPDE